MTNPMNILVTMPAAVEHRRMLLEAAPEARIVYAKATELALDEITSADIIVGNILGNQLPLLGSPRLIQLNTAGVAKEYLGLIRDLPGTALCCASGSYGPAISEHMLATLLGLMKRLHEYRDDQGEALWIDRGEVRSLKGARVLVVGLGDIGGCFARLCAAMGAQVSGIRRRPGPAPAGVEAVFAASSLEALLPEADVVALCLPETADTIRIMDKKRLMLMKQGSYLLNVGRGTALDQDALLQALREGRVAGAGLDVTDPEPLPKDHPLWREKNIVITPHVSGWYHLRETHDRIIAMACRNIQALPDGPFEGLVDFDSGYRA
ncbi:MAG: D-2-hydroxyacid dehydrogenase [Rectinemataceae bacterium]